MSLKSRIVTVIFTALAVVLVAAFPPIVAKSFASTSVGYNFDSSGDVANGFNSYIPNGSSVTQSATGGLGNTGAINAASGNQYAVFASKASYSIGPVGSTYTFSSFIQSIGGNGYTGMGFTSYAQPANTNTTSAVTTPPFRPSDALGVSVHGGGFYFHNGATDFTGLWNGASTDSAITVVSAPASHDVIGNSSLAPDRWFKVLLVITRDTSTTFDMHLEVWPANSDGTLRTQTAHVVMELNNQTNSALSTSPSINTYINFSGDRVRYLDNYEVSLAGGSSVIAAGTPVVLTGAATDASNVVTVIGNVTGTGGASVTERGIVYSTATSPTLSDAKLPVGSGTGTYTGTTPALPNGTYYFRAYATNSTGTSYGTEEQLTLASLVATPIISTPSVTPIVELAQTGAKTGTFTWEFGVALIAILSGVGFTAMSASRRQIRYKKLPHSQS